MCTTKGTNTRLLDELHVSTRKFNLQAKILALDHISSFQYDISNDIIFIVYVLSKVQVPRFMSSCIWHHILFVAYWTAHICISDYIYIVQRHWAMNLQGFGRIRHISSLVMLSLHVCCEGKRRPRVIRCCNPE